MTESEGGNMERTPVGFGVVVIALAISVVLVHTGCAGSFAIGSDTEDAGLVGDAGNPGDPDAPSLTGDGIAPQPECAAATKLVFVLTLDFQLLRFDPGALTFTPVGKVDCAVQAGITPNSMAIDRRGTAWMNFTDGQMFFVSTTDAHCAPTSYVRNQHGFNTYGMAFVADAPQSSSETLFIMDRESPRIGKVDPSTLVVTEVGPFFDDSQPGPWPLPPGGGDMTGTGDARLYAFYSNFGAVFSEIDKKSGTAIGIQKIPSLMPAAGIAVAQWGGSFWLLTGDPGKGT